jgi:hypothetical protein
MLIIEFRPGCPLMVRKCIIIQVQSLNISNLFKPYCRCAEGLHFSQEIGTCVWARESGRWVNMYCTLESVIELTHLKVVGNEKKGWLRFLQLLEISLGPWRSMSILILNVPFATEKCISVSACSSKMKRRFV